MSTYIQQLTNPTYPFQKREAVKRVDEYDTDAYVTDGIVRWRSSNNVPPQDILDLWAYCKKPFDMAASIAAREQEQAEFLREYIARRRQAGPSNEERMHARAAFGPGKTVVDAVASISYRT